ncbi:hypothetical protein EVJ50_10840 [Synechococcus sp. RSCCF101]|uniref:hypothetical protein n=1 Tax=Synechococcus sp. RSCCF101 TaxID=2511069 RepID=UPI001248ED9A|nr:hypothetical protein [Synechococcus sp. RSCCF101]QEY32646.1 hypothetical protein EVJ50_10840 [Synechococcus sp. RSCCF101]
MALHEAEPGDLLVSVAGERVYLAGSFEPGVPNGLYDGEVRVVGPEGDERHAEVNAVCSMPDLPGWPAYDNIYGRWLETPGSAGEEGGDTHWQTLLPFEGEPSESGPEPSPAWAQRLARNLCRKGSFSDTPPQDPI